MIERRRGVGHRLGYYRRAVCGMHLLLRTPRYQDPEAVVRRQLANRVPVWLDLVRRVVFGNEKNPYRHLFRRAGCSFGDLEAAVARDGLETTLEVLRREGVYLSHDELKGRKPIVRGDLRIDVTAEDFLNPITRGHLKSSSNGNRGAGAHTGRNIPSWLYNEARCWLRMRELGMENRVHVAVKPILPTGDGLMSMIMSSRAGLKTGPWFSTMAAALDTSHYRFATNALVTLARLYGEHVPYPVSLERNDYSPVSLWLDRRCREHIPAVVSSPPSAAARVAAAAIENGHDIRNTIFYVAGEALTDSRRRIIEAAGSEVYPGYPISEIGPVGLACQQMRFGNMVHICEDAVAVISYKRRAPLADIEVDSLLITTLLQHGAYVLINAEMEDSGIIEDATCDCSFSRIGWSRCIRNIASFGKLTGAGVTLVGTEVVQVLKERLPTRFGGSFSDYQLVERDGPTEARIELRVSPRVRVKSLDDVGDFFLREIRQFPGGAGASRVWRSAASVRVVHEEPIPNTRGKVLPMCLMGTGAPAGTEVSRGGH